MTLTLWVPGIPKAKGSLRAFVVTDRRTGAPQARVRNDNPATRPWAAAVSAAAMEARGYTAPITFLRDVGVGLQATFYLPRPQRVLSKRCLHPVVKPDLDKLLRAILDACTGILWTDDSQVVAVTAVKAYATATQPPGVRMRVAPIYAVESAHAESVEHVTAPRLWGSADRIHAPVVAPRTPAQPQRP